MMCSYIAFLFNLRQLSWKNKNINFFLFFFQLEPVPAQVEVKVEETTMVDTPKVPEVSDVVVAPLDREEPAKTIEPEERSASSSPSPPPTKAPSPPKISPFMSRRHHENSNKFRIPKKPQSPSQNDEPVSRSKIGGTMAGKKRHEPRIKTERSEKKPKLNE